MISTSGGAASMSHRSQASTSSLRSSLEIVPYTPLGAQEIEDTLVDLAHPYTGVLDLALGIKADGVSIQPCKATASQDRYVVEQFSLVEGGGMWTLTGVFDGHLGDATVEHTAHHLPVIIQEFLTKEYARSPGAVSHPASVARILKHAITSFDRDIVRDVAQLFPDGLGASLDKLSDAEIRAVINDYDNGLKNYKKVQLCLYGTTALVALVDPKRENVWVANLGDCQAVLASRRADGSWSSEFLTRSHNGTDEREVARVRDEHPGEPECIKNGRVLGAIAPFRCIGDQPFKLPPSFTRRVLFNLDPGYTNKAPWEQFLRRNLTPPYISADAEVVHRRIVPTRAPGAQTNHFLILCTDGLGDLYEDVRGKQELADRYVRAVVGPVPKPFSVDENYALKLLRSALGGEDLDAVSQLLTVQTEKTWLDDTTVIVQLL